MSNLKCSSYSVNLSSQFRLSFAAHPKNREIVLFLINSRIFTQVICFHPTASDKLSKCFHNVTISTFLTKRNIFFKMPMVSWKEKEIKFWNRSFFFFFLFFYKKYYLCNIVQCCLHVQTVKPAPAHTRRWGSFIPGYKDKLTLCQNRGTLLHSIND